MPVNPSIKNVPDHLAAHIMAPGMHALRITLEQIGDFYFVYHLEFIGIPDPAGLDGRRVFSRGERVGDTLVFDRGVEGHWTVGSDGIFGYSLLSRPVITINLLDGLHYLACPGEKK